MAIASQLILIKSRAMLPRRTVEGPVALADEGPDPEAELRARLILYRAFRDAGARLLDEAVVRVGLFRREPAAAHAAGLAGARPPAAEPLSPALLVLALDGLARVAPAARAAARDDPPDGDPDVAGRDHPRGAPAAPRSSCSRTCCAASATGSWSR